MSRNGDSDFNAVRLLDALPSLGEDLPDEVLAEARRLVACPVVHLSPGAPLDLSAAHNARGAPIDAVVVAGCVKARRTVGPRTTLRLYGPGDLLGVDQGRDGAEGLPTEFSAHDSATVAVLDDRLVGAVRALPNLLRGVMRMAAAQAARAEAFGAIMALPRVDDRLLAALMMLAERWGRMTPDGILLELALTHEELGDMVGAARPTVSLALTRLARDEHIFSTGYAWLIQPPGADVEAEPPPPHAENRDRARRIREVSVRLRTELRSGRLEAAARRDGAAPAER